MNNIKITKNPFLFLLPFLILYIAIVFTFPTNGTFGDEGRYLAYAHNLLHGFYSLPAPNLYVGNGPGYPILLMPFVALHLPLICITFLNAILYYLSAVFLFKASRQIVSFRLSLIISLFFAMYFNSYEYLPIVYTETFTIFLISLIILTLFKTFNSKKSNKYMFLSGFLIGFLALTKVIFGYVIIFLLVGVVILWIISKHPYNYKRSIFILLISILIVIPYLTYTYNLTGQIFYWTSNGGNNLYWMTTPNKGEYGDWIQYPIDHNKNRISESNEIIQSYHQKDFNEIFKYEGVKRDDEYKKIAVNNIKAHPVKFIQNCISNIGRILFNFPFSYTLQKPGTLLRLPFSGIIVVLMLFCIIPTLKNWRKIFFPIRLLLLFTFLYLGGSVLGSAETRMFTMIVPILLLWIAFIVERTVKITLKLNE